MKACDLYNVSKRTLKEYEPMRYPPCDTCKESYVMHITRGERGVAVTLPNDLTTPKAGVLAMKEYRWSGMERLMKKVQPGKLPINK